MEFRLTCECGRRLNLTDGAAGSAVACECGRTVQVPSLGELRRQFTDDVDIKIPTESSLTVGHLALIVLGVLVFGTGFWAGYFWCFAHGRFTGLGYLIAQAGLIWLFVLMVRECSPTAVLLAFVVPFFTWYFAYQRWDIAKWAFACNVGGIALTLFGIFLANY
ncbi:MAG: hypothetical protein L0215_04205 [Gemmataceae bacterium]|nr:hypothetical protein [Gemmataceae bacterium]